MKIKIDLPDQPWLVIAIADAIAVASDNAHSRDERALGDALSNIYKTIKRRRYE